MHCFMRYEFPFRTKKGMADGRSDGKYWTGIPLWGTFHHLDASVVCLLFTATDATIVTASTPRITTRDTHTGMWTRSEAKSLNATNSRITPSPYFRYLRDSSPPRMAK